MANGGNQDPAIMKMINQHLQQQLQLTDQLVEKHNMLETTESKRYTKMGLIEQRKKTALETTVTQLDMMKSSDIALANQLASLEQIASLHGELTPAQEQQRAMVEEVLRLRREEPAALDASIQKLSQKAALQRQALADAEKEKELIDKQAHAFGAKVANMMGMKKPQDSMFKSFMKSGNKIEFMKAAMKGFVSQLNFASIGVKVMQSGFQMLSMVIGKIMGGGGGGGKNLSEFVKMTGHASGNFHSMAKSGARLAKKLKVGYEEGAKAIGDLMNHMTGFMDMNRRMQGQVGAHTIKFMAFNVSAETTSKVLSNLTKTMGQSTKQAMKTQMKFFNAATTLGIPVEKMMDDFNDFMKDVPGLGKKAEKTFLRLSAAAKKIGVEMKSMIDLGKGFETYEDAMDKAANMNAMFGKQVLDGMALNEAALRGPEEAFKEMNKQLAASGKNLKDMSRVEKLEAADMLGMDIGDMEKMLQGEKSLSDTQKAMSQVDKLTGSVRNFNKALKKTKPPGGGGRKDFLSMILWEYNKITGGKFFKNVREMRRWLRQKIKEAAKFIACWIRKIETFFLDGATRFLDRWGDAIDSFGKMIGIEDLSKKAKDFVKELDGWGPVLIPVLVIVGGKIASIVGHIVNLTVSLLPKLWGLLKTGGKLLKDFAFGFKDRMLAAKEGFTGGGSLIEKMKGGFKGLFGIGQAGLAEQQRKAQPVRIAESWGYGTDAVPTTGGGDDGGGILDTVQNLAALKGGRNIKLGKAGRWKRFKAGAKGWKKGWAKGKKTGIGRFRGAFQGRRAGVDKANRLFQANQMKAAGFSKQQIISAHKGGFLGTGGAGGMTDDLFMKNVRRAPKGGIHIGEKFYKGGQTLPKSYAGGGMDLSGRLSQASNVAGAVDEGGKLGKIGQAKQWLGNTKAGKLWTGASQKLSAVGTKAASLPVIGKPLGMIGKKLPIIGTAISAVGGVSKLIDGDVSGGLKDLAQGALMMAGPLGMVAGGLWMAYDYFNQLGDSTVSYQQTLDAMSDKGKQLNATYDNQIKQQQKQAAEERQHQQAQAGIASSSGVGMHLMAEQARNMKATQQMGGTATAGAASLLEASAGEYGALQSDAWTKGGRKRDIWGNLAKFRTESQKKQAGFLQTLKTQQADLAAADKDGTLATEEATAAIKQARDEALKRFAETRKAHIKVLKATEAYKDPYGVYASKEAQNRQAMIDGANIRLDHAQELALMEAENIAKQKILLGRLKQKRASYQQLTKEEMGLTEAKWSMDAQRQMLRLEQLKAEGATSKKLYDALGGDDALKMLKGQLGEAKLDQAMREAQFKEMHRNSSELRQVSGKDAYGKRGLQMTEMVESLQAIGVDADEHFGKMLDKGGVGHGLNFDKKDSDKMREQGLAAYAKSWQNAMNDQTEGAQQSYLDALKESLGEDKYAAFIEQMKQKQMANLTGVIDAATPAYQNLFTGVGGKGVSDVGMMFKEKMGMTGNQIIEFRDKYSELYKLALTKGSKYEGWSPMKIAEQAAKDLKLDFSLAKQAVKEVATEAKKVEAEDLAEKGFKVSKKDINMIKEYQTLLTEFVNALEKGKVEEKFKPFAEGMAQLNAVFQNKQAAHGLDMASTFFYQLRGLKTKHATILSTVTEGVAGNITAITNAEKEWQKLKKVIEATEQTTGGALFFKGGDINHTVNSTTTVKLVIGGRTMGDATLEGLKATGKVDMESVLK